MQTKEAKSIETQKGPTDYFTGNVWLNRFVKDEGTRCNVAKVTFEPGARTHWHTHPVSQILIVTEGKGYVQKAGATVQLLSSGDVVMILADERHWHGAMADSLFSHIAIQPLDEQGKDVHWLEPVTNEEYEMR